MDKKTRKDRTDRYINDFAARSFRDIADGDYIAARMACRAGLMPQFLWSAQQAFEKYLKYLLLVNRIPAKRVRHDIGAALKLTEKLPFKVEIRPKAMAFIQHVAQYGPYRYLDVSYYVLGYPLRDLDTAVWDLRRYCQILNVFGKKLPPVEQKLLAAAQAMLKTSSDRPPQEFRLHQRLLEKILNNKEHSARPALIWQNGFFGSSPRRRVRVQHHLQASNAPLWLYPEMLDELLKYVFIPDAVEKGYREHLKTVLADPSKRP